MALTGIFNSHLIMALAIERFGTDEQKTRLAAASFATGEIRGGLALTEPDAGTDLQGDPHDARGATATTTSSTAPRPGSPTASRASCFALLVKTDPEREPRHKGMSLFIAAKRPGFTVGRKLREARLQGRSTTAELVFEDYRVPADHLIGGVEGQGFYQATGGLELGRINVAARGVGVAEGALEARDRIRPAAQDLRQADLRAPGDPAQARRDGDHARAAARLLTLDAAARLRHAASAATWRPAWPSISPPRPRSRTASRRMRIHGGYGYSKEFDVERLYRDAPLMCIGEGTNEMQRIIIAKQLDRAEPG